jgi:hypothetical protein
MTTVRRRRPQPQEDFIYGGHFSPLLARLLRRRLPMLPPKARVIAWHRYSGDVPPVVTLCADVRLPSGGVASARMPFSAELLWAGRPWRRMVVCAAIDQLGRFLWSVLEPRIHEGRESVLG